MQSKNLLASSDRKDVIWHEHPVCETRGETRGHILYYCEECTSNPIDAFWHEHPVYQIWSRSLPGAFQCECQVCGELINDRHVIAQVYHCLHCQLEWHVSCVPSSPDNINHPCHLTHPLEFLMQGPPNYAQGKCNLCQQKLSGIVYYCKLCDFGVDMICVLDPPPLTVDHPKCHQHALTLMGRDVSFACNSCGTHGERNPYVCLPCSLMFHYDCIDLPHVININRHEHRISHTCPLPPRDWTCEICRKNINWRYGAYSCKKCPDFFVHSLCATNEDVWDGIELEGEPEEEEDTAAFKVIDKGEINHFSHPEHNLFLIEDVIIDGGEGMLCHACSHSICFERYYNCMECEFMLHEKCANLPLQKRHALSTRILSLHFGLEKDTLFLCSACGRYGTGFRYDDGDDMALDVHCASLSWFRHRKLHPHTLFLTTLDKGDCVGCDKTNTLVLRCVECEYSLDFSCATLPVVIKHRCDDHYLFLSSGEKANGKYWCEICEAQVNPEKWFYTCHDCGVVCHIDCVTGDSLNIRPVFLSYCGEAILNNHNTRPLCSKCGSRCRFPMVYNFPDGNIGGLVCSLNCIFPQSESSDDDLIFEGLPGCSGRNE